MLGVYTIDNIGSIQKEAVKGLGFGVPLSPRSEVF